MGPVLLDVVNYSNLYDAWNGYSLEDIQGFDSREVTGSFIQDDTPKGPPDSEVTKGNNSVHQPKCFKETWIEQLPKVLMFNLKRVTYDPKVRDLVKNNKRFEFEKVIYADKFLKENKNKDEELNQQINDYREK